MGQEERARENRKQNKRDAAKESRGRRASSAVTIDLRKVNWVELAALLCVFAEAGGAVRVGYTRDGGALALGVYLGDDYATEYIRPHEDLSAALLEIAEAWLPEEGATYHQALQEFNRSQNAQK